MNEEHKTRNEDINIEDSTETNLSKMMDHKVWISELDNNTTMKDKEKIIIQETSKRIMKNKV